MSRVQKAERLFYIVKYLDNHETATARELAYHCQTSVRSIYRDMRFLEELGFYYTNEGKKGYRLITQPAPTASNLTREEWMALVLFPILSNGITSGDHPYHHAYLSGLEKIGKKVQSKNSISPISSQLGDRILFHDQYRETYLPEVMSIVIEAIADDKSIDITYYSIYRDGVSQRLIDPYYLVPREGHLYIIGYCHLREEIRIFRMNRIQSIQITEQSFKLPKSFHIKEYLANRWSIYGDEIEPITFVVEFRQEVARYIQEYEFYTKTVLTEKENGNLLLKTKVKSKNEFLRWLRSFGINAEVLEPLDVREELKVEYEQMAIQYQNRVQN